MFIYFISLMTGLLMMALMPFVSVTSLVIHCFLDSVFLCVISLRKFGTVLDDRVAVIPLSIVMSLSLTTVKSKMALNAVMSCKSFDVF
jgi:hypothetical protein